MNRSKANDESSDDVNKTSIVEERMDFKNYRIQRKIRKRIAFFLTGALLLTIPTIDNLKTVYASSATEKRDEAQQGLENIQQEMNNLEAQQNQVQAELSEKASVLSELLGEQQILENDIKETQVAIDQTQADLEVAKEKERLEYEAMKLRIQYMYENSSSDSIWEAIFEANGIADMLNRVEYVTQVHKTDRELLAAYKATVAQVEQLAEELDSKMNDLTTMQEVLVHQEEQLRTTMEALQAESANFEEQLAAAQSRATQYAEEIARQNEIIRQEEIRREQERKEQERKEQERKEQERKEKERLEKERLEQERKEKEQKEKEEKEKEQLANNNNTNNNNSNSNSSNNTNNNNANSSSSNANNNSSNSSSSNSTNNNNSDLNNSKNDPAFTTGVTGAELVNYALKFVGNPYKWGGNSLTNGCDCSGFVHLVYKHFGISVPRYSQSFKTVGRAVSYENLKAGDIVVYPGHVAIYIGNGKIVEAQSTKAGITSNRKVNCSTITAIRRVL